MRVHKFIPVALAARLIGIAPNKARLAAEAGRFGPVLRRKRCKETGDHALFVSTRGVELTAGIVLSTYAFGLAASAEGSELTIMPEAEKLGDRELDSIALAARVVRAPHDVDQLEELELADD